MKVGAILYLCATVSAQAQETDDLEAVVVTGSHIRGTGAAGSNLTVISRDQIDMSGYGRVADVLATVSLNFNRANEAVRGGTDVDNFNRGAEVQLRGLGVGTTLTLVNGQRQGASGFQGSYIDVSTIPVAAVDRIEILPEGSSALYGSDAIGGIVNILFRRDFQGFEIRSRGATAGGDGTERSVAGLWGHAGANGHLMIGFQYDDSRALECAARAVCAANADFRQFGGTDLRGFASNPGTILDPETTQPVAAIAHGQDGTNLTPADLIPGAINYTDVVSHTDVLPKQVMRSAFLDAGYQLPNSWELSVGGRYSERDFDAAFPQATGNFSVPATNAFNPFGADVLVAYDFTRDLGAVVDSGRTATSFVSLGLAGPLAHEWQLHLNGAYSRSRSDFREGNILDPAAADPALADPDPSTALNIFGDGSHTNPATLATLHYDYEAINVFTTTMASVVADGPIAGVSAGPIRAAVGGDFRREHSQGVNIADLPENRGRDVAAAFAELSVPLVVANAGSTVDQLVLSLAGRYDQYSDVGGTFNPKLGLTWHVSRALALRGNWGTSFRPPPFIWSNPDQIGDAQVADVDDPESASGQSRALLLFGPIRDLEPETSTSWSAGVDVTPPALRDLVLSLTYFDVDYRGQIRNPGPFARIFLTQEAQFAALVTRDPTRAQLAAACDGIRFVPGSIGDCNQPITAILDNRFRNLAFVKTRGVDFALDYDFDVARGRLALGVDGTYTIAAEQAITPASPVFDVVDTVGYPLQLRWAVHVSWSSGGWTAQTAVNYAGGYRDTNSEPVREVDAWTTVDLNIRYRTRAGQGWMAGTECDLGVNNLFDRAPPFVNAFDLDSGTLGYDAANASLVGRLVSLQFVKHWGS